jgi:hypothetical protein
MYVPFEDEASRALASKRMNKKQAKALAVKITQMMNDLDKLKSAIDKAAGTVKIAPPPRRPVTMAPQPGGVL